MPEGAAISAEEAFQRWEGGERGYLRGWFDGVWWDLSEEPMFVQLDTQLRLTTKDMTAKPLLPSNVLRAVRLDVCLSSKRGGRLEKRITPSQAERLERADSSCKNGSED